MSSRTNTSAGDTAGWVIAVLAVAFVLPANDLVSRSIYLWRVYDVSPWTWVVVQAFVLIAAWAVVASLLVAFRRLLSPAGWDVAWSVTVGGLAVVAFAGMLTAVSGSDGDAWLAVAAWFGGLLLAVLVAVLARRVALGRALVVAGSVAALVPIVLMASGVEASPATRSTQAGIPDGAPSVIWVIADSLRGDVVFDSEGAVREIFPNLRALASASTIYTRAFTVANRTEVAVPGMLAFGENGFDVGEAVGPAVGLDAGIVAAVARTHDVVVRSPLGGVSCDPGGCASNAVSGGGSSMPTDLEFGLDALAVMGSRTLAPPLSGFFPPTSFTWGRFWHPEIDRIPVDTFLEALQTSHTSSSGRPVFALWHTMVTHAPWTVDEQGRDIVPAHMPVTSGSPWIGSSGESGLLTEDLVRLTRALYVMGALEFDRQLGVLLDQLRADGRFDDAVIVVTADHGEALGVGQVQTRDPSSPADLWSEVARVPLIIKGSGQREPVAVSSPRSLAQLPRTVLDAIGATSVEPLSGVPGLGKDLEQGPMLTIVADDGGETVRYPGSVNTEGWSVDLYRGLAAGHPFAIGIDPRLIGAPVPADWRQVEVSGVTRIGDESPLALFLPQARAGAPCAAARAGGVSIDGVVVGSVLWELRAREGESGVRGWSVLTDQPVERMTWWCQSP